MPMYTAIKDSIYRLLKLVDLAAELGVDPQMLRHRAENKRQTRQAVERVKAADAVRAAEIARGKNEVGEFRLAAHEEPPTGGVCSVCLRPVAEHQDGEACWHPTIGTHAPGRIDDDLTGSPTGLDGCTPDPLVDWPDGFGPAPAAFGDAAGGAAAFVASRSDGHATLTDLANRLDRVQVDLSRLGAAVRALSEPQPDDEDVLIKMRQPVAPGLIAQICGAIEAQVQIYGDGEWMVVRRWRGGDA